MFSKSIALSKLTSALLTLSLLMTASAAVQHSERASSENESLESLVNLGIEADDEDAEDTIETDFGPRIGEAPESLRLYPEHDPFIASTLGPLGLLETFAPEMPAQLPGDFDKEAVLDDYRGLISDTFQIPEPLRDRVGFWFDIYTKYDSHHRVIHHSEFPWIIYKIVDVSFIIESDSPRRLWMRREKADRFVKAEAKRIQAALKSLSRKRKGAKLSELEQKVAEALSGLKGNPQRNAKTAARQLRVQTGQKNFFFTGIQNSKLFLPTMEGIFRAHRLPIELTRLPFVESSFNEHATSKVGASGIWQFMDATGRKFLHIDNHIDERRSPLKATEAAARLLKENHLILRRSWPLAITAWNHGPSGIRRAMRATQSQDIATIVRKYRSRTFDFASANFYTEFLAALYAEKYSREIYGPVEQAAYDELHTVKLTRSIRFNDFLRASGLGLEDFLMINPELANVAKRNLALRRGFKLHVPTKALANLERLVALQTELSNESSG